MTSDFRELLCRTRDHVLSREKVLKAHQVDLCHRERSLKTKEEQVNDKLERLNVRIFVLALCIAFTIESYFIHVFYTFSIVGERGEFERKAGPSQHVQGCHVVPTGSESQTTR